MRYMLDTNVCIDFMKGRSSSIRDKIASCAGEICISAITLSELLYGVERSQNRLYNLIVLQKFLAGIEILDYNNSCAALYGSIRAKLASCGEMIGPMDLLIASHALSEGLILITHNTREFSRVEGLIIEDWYE